MLLNNEKGIVTTDFLFALVIACGMSALVFALTFTLSVVEAAQYIVYSAARAQAASHEDPKKQEAMARTKYDQLITSKEFAPLFSNGWFEISNKTSVEVAQGSFSDNGKSFSSDYPAKGGTNREVFQGVRTSLLAKMLELNLPFIGKITPEDDGFRTRIAAIMIREPSMAECLNYMKLRKEKMWEIDDRRFSNLPRAADIATPWEDNGC